MRVFGLLDGNRAGVRSSGRGDNRIGGIGSHVTARPPESPGPQDSRTGCVPSDSSFPGGLMAKALGGREQVVGVVRWLQSSGLARPRERLCPRGSKWGPAPRGPLFLPGPLAPPCLPPGSPGPLPGPALGAAGRGDPVTRVTQSQSRRVSLGGEGEQETARGWFPK